MKRSRALLALIPVALTATLLTACSADASNEGSSFECAPEGSISKALEFDGDFGTQELQLATETPIKATALESSTLIEGDGDQVQEGGTAEAQFTIFKGSDGSVLQSQPSTLDIQEENLLPWALQTVGCAKVGDRVAAVSPVSDILGEGGGAAYELEDSDSLVLVFDVTGFDAGCETLAPRDEKYPEVDLGDGTAEPVITIAECMEPPAELEVEVLEEGDGAVVESDQNIMTKYVGVFWENGERFDGNWSETGVAFSTAEGRLIDGFRQAMIGQKIGSTILVTVPSELGYNDGEARTFVLQLVSEAADAELEPAE